MAVTPKATAAFRPVFRFPQQLRESQPVLGVSSERITKGRCHFARELSPPRQALTVQTGNILGTSVRGLLSIHLSGSEPAAHNPHSLDERNAFMRHLPGSETQSVTAEQRESSRPPRN